MMLEIIKPVHVGCALLTLCFFAWRGVMQFRDPAFTGRLWVRRTAESVDTLLFVTGVTLVWMTGQLPWQEMWLAAKLVALLGYILLGMVAFHWSNSRAVKMVSWIAAMVTYVFMVSVALSRNPWPF